MYVERIKGNMKLSVGNQILNCDSGRVFKTSNGEELVLTKNLPNSYDSRLTLYKVNADGSLKPLKDKKYINFPLMRHIIKDDFVKEVGSVREFNALDCNSKIAQNPCSITLHSGKYNRMLGYNEYPKAVRINGEWVAPKSDFMKPIKESEFLNMGITKNLRSSMKVFEEFCTKFSKLGDEVYIRVMKQLLSSSLK